MSNSSVFNIRAKVLKSLQDLQLNDREFQTAGALTLKALLWPTMSMTCAVQKLVGAVLNRRLPYIDRTIDRLILILTLVDLPELGLRALTCHRVGLQAISHRQCNY